MNEKLLLEYGKASGFNVIGNNIISDTFHINITKKMEKFAELVANTVPDGWIGVEHSLPDKKCFAFYKDELGNSRTVCANYIKKYTQEAGMDDEWSEYCDADDTYYYPEGWYELIDNWGDYSFITINHQVTHWMPLPATPVIENIGE